MPDYKISQLPVLTDVQTTDILPIVDDPGGSPVTKQATVKDVLGHDAARVYNNAAISVADSAWTILSFNTERYDTASLHSPSVNPSRLTAARAGVYVIAGFVSFAANANGLRVVEVYLNGATVIAANQNNTPGSLGSINNIFCIYELAAADYVELRVFQSSGGALDVQSIAAWTPEFTMARIG